MKKTIRLGDVVEIEAPGLQGPHGLCFLDDATVAVANRNDHVEVFDLPPPSATLRHKVAARQTPVGGTAGPINTPGSVAALAIDARRTAGPGNETAARRGAARLPAQSLACRHGSSEPRRQIHDRNQADA